MDQLILPLMLDDCTLVGPMISHWQDILVNINSSMDFAVHLLVHLLQICTSLSSV